LNGQSRSSPGGWDEAVSSRESCESAGIGPGKVPRAQRRTVVTGVLFSQTTVRWGIFGVDEDETIGEVFDRSGQGRVSRCRRCVRPDGKVGDELTEEGEGGGGDVDVFLLLPDNESVVELFSNSEGG